MKYVFKMDEYDDEDVLESKYIHDINTAAEQIAEDYHTRTVDWHTGEIEVFVRRPEDSEFTKFSVGIEYVPSFHATRIK